MLQPLFKVTEKLLDDKLEVVRILSKTEFIVFHEDLQTFLIMKQIPNDENLTPWIDLPPHSNIVNCFHQFTHNLNDKTIKLSLTEMTNAGDMYKFISSQNLNLGIKVPLSYMEIIFDCMIQLTLGLEYAHSNGVVHGSFGLNNVHMAKDGDTFIFKISNFTPTSSMKLPTLAKAGNWPFMREGSRNNPEF